MGTAVFELRKTW